MGRELRVVPVADIVLDESVYPRHQIDRSYVMDLVRALEAGAQLPPPLLEEGTQRCVDGFHRVSAHRKVDPGCGIPCEMETYADETALVAAAIEANAAHGRKLDAQDKTRAALMLKQRGYDTRQIAVVLHTTTARVEQLTVRVVLVDSKLQPAKPVCYPTRGESPRRLSGDQYAVMRSSSGRRTAQTVTQLSNELAAGLIDVEKHRGALEQLRQALDLVLEGVPA